jgi:hypothetical protein
MLNPIRTTEFGFRSLLRFLWRARGWIIGTSAVLLLLAAAGFYLFGTTCGGSDIKEAGIQMGHIEQSLDMYYATSSPHEYPRALDQLVEKRIMQDIPHDPWGQRYVYFSTNRTQFVLLSAGPDGELATEDDIAPGGSQAGHFDAGGSNWADKLLEAQ